MKKSLLTLAALVALTACSSKEEAPAPAPVTETATEMPAPQPVEPHWSRANTSIAETAQQISRCEYDVGMNTAIPDNKRHELFDACMKKEGYSWVE